LFIAKLSTKRVQENCSDVVQAAGSIQKDKLNIFVYYISGVPVCTYLRGYVGRFPYLVPYGASGLIAGGE